MVAACLALGACTLDFDHLTSSLDRDASQTDLDAGARGDRYVPGDRELPGEHDAARDGSSLEGCDAGDPSCDACPPRRDVDLLIVMDNSQSMIDQRSALAGQLAEVFRVLETGDLDADGAPEFTPFRSVHAGVITNDLGAGVVGALAGCEPPGDDAKLLSRGDMTLLGCAESYDPPFVSFSSGSGGSAVAAKDLECILRAFDSTGCGYEHTLEAMLKAVSNEQTDWKFVFGKGQADLANSGFFRDDALLAILVVTDEDDCSQRDLDAARLWSERFSEVGLQLRCEFAPHALAPLSRYVHGLRGIKARASDVVFSVIAGVPDALVQDAEPGSYQSVLADADMKYRASGPITDFSSRVLPACTLGDNVSATPARRLIEVANELGDHGMVQSICAESMRPGLRRIMGVIGHAGDHPSCEQDQCPCDDPFVCEDGRCVCDATVSCEDAECDAVNDGCGGAHFCGLCPGTMQCAMAGNPNVCESTSTCPVGHVCGTIYLHNAIVPSRVTVSGFDQLDPYPVLAMQSPLFQATGSITETEPSNGSYTFDVDLSGIDYAALPVDGVHLVVAVLQSDADALPDPRDEWYVRETRLWLTAAAIADLGAFSTWPIPLTADVTATPGHDGEGVVLCEGAACYGRCCAPGVGGLQSCASALSGGACPSETTQVGVCDGPEDCGPSRVCCVEDSVGSIATYCTAPQLCSLHACHLDADCSSLDADATCSLVSPISRCVMP